VTGSIGYYVHHHGDGHRQRALTIARAMPGRITLIGTGLAGRTGNIPSLDLPDDRPTGIEAFDGRDGAADRPEALHYAPLDNAGVRTRTAKLAQWIDHQKPALMIVDVSVEVAMLARLMSTRTVYVRLAGRREDTPHLEAFRAVCALIAPFHAELDDPATPSWIRCKTAFLPGLSAAKPRPGEGQTDTVLVVVGKGGPPGSGDDLAAAARATPDLSWRVIGPASEPRDCPANLILLGWVDDADAEIARAGLVIGAGGDGLVNAVLATGRPFICLPQPRPFDEQTSKARRLNALGAAITLEAWPDASAWPALTAAARRLDPADQRRLHDPDGAERAARWLSQIVENGATHEHG
jgi:predicted glycosyltransferase